LLNVLTLHEDVLPNTSCAVNLDFVAVDQLGILEHHNSVCTIGDRTASVHLRGLSGVHFKGWGFPHQDFTDQP
jgi:hypothetical protein